MTASNQSLQQVVAEARLFHFREMLLASGWERDADDGWLAPLTMREAVGKQYGRGHLHLWDALNAQTRRDLWLTTEAVAEAA